MDTNEIIARLRHMVRIGDAMNACRTESNNVLAAAADLLEAQQAKIDRLMLEHCSGEMTPEQVAEWGKHQRPLPEGPGHE